MDRGVFVGGLMICGSFLLAAMLNRSAMEEMPEPAAPAPAEALPAMAPIAGSETVPSKACAEEQAKVGTQPAIGQAESAGADLMVNGTERCTR